MAKTAFSDGNPLLGILGTIVNAAFLNKIFNHRHDGLDQDGSGPLDYAADTGAADAYAIALTPALAAHVEGMPIHFKAANANTGAATLSVNNMAVKSIIMPDGSALTAGSIKAGQIITVAYTGAAYMIISGMAGNQSWQTLTGSRSFGTTYYNTTGRNIKLKIAGSLSGSAPGSMTATIGGVVFSAQAVSESNGVIYQNISVPLDIDVPPGPYLITQINVTLQTWHELR